MIFWRKDTIMPRGMVFYPSYLIDKESQNHFNEYGYVILKNIISEDNITAAINFYKTLQQHDGYAVREKFESTGNFKSIELQRHIFSFIKDYMSENFKQIIDLNNCEIGEGGAFFIKPNTKQSKLEPHQDSPVIDETKVYAIFAWIPLQNIDNNNGALNVLPKSHRWGNSHRSQHIPWAFGNISKDLWKLMIPLYINKGDVILFDPSIIHSSSINNSESNRIVVCGAFLPKNHQKIEYIRDGNKIKKYFVDDNYWLNGGQIESLNNYEYEIFQNNFPKKVKYNMLKNLL